MKETMLQVILSSGVVLLTSLSATASIPQDIQAQVLPQENYEASVMAKSLANISQDKTAFTDQYTLSQGYLDTVRMQVESTPAEAKPTVAEPKPIAAAPSPAAVYTPASSYDDVYKQAGSKYGVPWQVLYGLHMTESGGRNGPIASGRGPQGPMQFMPGTWKAYAVDGDGDGVADINNANDAIHGAANYLAKHGSLAAGLRAYGGNTTRTLALARERGFTN